jgi:UDP-N-acetylmuramate--alanine ligase
MLQMGYEVTGSDRQETSTTRGLREAGATIWIGHDERYARMADLIVTSTAIPEDNPEIKFAKQRGMPLLTRIELLAYLTERKQSIIISGSHGKSTTSSMVATAFYASQRDPWVVLGASCKHPAIRSSRKGESDYFICEGDESNNSILEFTPTVAVVTNIDCDHLNFHGSLANLKNSFIKFLNSPGRRGFSVVCLDDDNIRSIMSKLTGKIITYGFNPDADYQAQGRRLEGDGRLQFEVHHKDRGPLGEVSLPVPGDHSIQNALCTIAISCELGLTFNNVSFALDNFPGVSRRYDKLYEDRDYVVIDDYAHHPSEVHALLSGVREAYHGRRLRVVFQPHRYTRSKELAQQFPPAFMAADEIILAPIYTAYEQPIAGIGLDYLNRFFKRRYDERKLKCLSEFSQINEYLLDSIQPGDVIMTIGAGNVVEIGRELARQLNQRQSEQAESVDFTRLSAGMPDEIEFYPEQTEEASLSLGEAGLSEEIDGFSN